MVKMMRTGLSKYWSFQLVGWGTFTLVNLFFAISFDGLNLLFLKRLLFFVVPGFIASHYMRSSNRRLRVLQRRQDVQILYGLLITVAHSIVVGLCVSALVELFDARTDSEIEEEFTFPQLWLRNTFLGFVYLLIWNLIYFIYHYVENSRSQKVNNLRLESVVKELELKTIKAHINPHFIFNALNSIRALVDENPERARRAITELSNILRSSMQADKMETVPLERELNIVRDYLALEQMRFEERLKVEFDIDEDTLDQPVPPMMLQTLVENAIKHGISKQVNGGWIKIKSDFVNDHHEIIIQNSGKLNGISSPEGFGLQSTQNRLSLLFGEKASFDIHDTDQNIVEARVILPVDMN